MLGDSYVQNSTRPIFIRRPMLRGSTSRWGQLSSSAPFTERGFFFVKFLDDFGILPNSGGNSTSLGTVTA